jgi:hypothetical protein
MRTIQDWLQRSFITVYRGLQMRLQNTPAGIYAVSHLEQSAGLVIKSVIG